MRDQLLHYYETELAFIRRMASAFAEKYPDIGEFLLLEANRSRDPHVERLIEAVAMLTARVHLRLDDEFPEVTEALLGILYPHYLAPIPSMSVAQLALDPEQGQAPGGIRVERHALLHATALDGVRSTFRTCYPLSLWPVELRAVELVSTSALEGVPAGTASALRLSLRTFAEKPVSELEIDRLAIFLDAEGGALHKLYELFCRQALGLCVRRGDGSGSRFLRAEAIRPLGFEADEGMLEYPPESFRGYRLLQEYFAFPDKFLFVELSGLGPLAGESKSDTLEIWVLLPQPLAEHDLRPVAANFKLWCTPIVNLFPHQADPIRLDQTAVEYRVTPDSRSPRAFEVHSIQRVTSSNPGRSESRDYHAFFALRHGMSQAKDASFWHATRRDSLRKGDLGTDVYLTLVDRDFDPLEPPEEVLSVSILCTNRDLPERLPFGDPLGDLSIEGRPEVRRINFLRKPTPTQRAPIGDQSRWRLVSHLALNHLSLAESAGEKRGASQAPLEALREILKLYDFADSPATRQRIDGLVGLRSRQVVRRVAQNGSSSFARGTELTLDFDEERFAGAGVYLFASVLERFLGLYTALNSFTQTVALVKQRHGELKRWPPRAGEMQLL
jgi:type VI secretion system protein ImpG